MRISTKTLCLLILFGATACGGTGFTQASNKKDATKSEDSAEDDENQKSDRPQEVSGAFLTCAYIDADSTNTDAASVVGCGVYQNEKKIDLGSKTAKLQLFDDKDQAVSIHTQAAPDSSPWHVLTSLPAPYHTAGYFKMTVDSSSYRLATKDIKQNTEAVLGRSAAGTTLNSPVASTSTTSGLALTQVTATASWHGGGLGFIRDAVNSDDFCNGGTPRSTLSSASSTLTSLFALPGQSPLVTNQISAADTNISASDATCFRQFDLISGGTGQAFAQQGSGCLFLRTKDNTLYIIPASSSEPNLTLDNLRKFARAKQCT